MAIGLGLAAVALTAAGLSLAYFRYRPPSDMNIANSLKVETWPAVPADAHHSNTDLFNYKEQYLLVHATSRWHFGSGNCRLAVRSSRDGKDWRLVSEIRLPGEDVRDPKFALIGDKLFLYFLRNKSFDPEPYGTMYCTSDDGATWTQPKELSIKGWLMWRPRTLDGVTYYAPAYWHEHGKANLFKSTDGMEWSDVGPIYEGDKVDETGAIFQPDGTMLMAARIEMQPSFWGYHPEGHTAIGVSRPPYTDWKINRSYATRLDGPCLFRVGDRVYACGRRHVGGSSYMGSVWGRKRTSLYLVLPDRLVFLSDLPSNGDTAYAGVVVDGDTVLISYYTSPLGHDYFWLMGMLSKTPIMMARFKTADLERLAEEKLASM